MRIMGIDPARLGLDHTVLMIRGSMSTAIEVEMRLQDYNRRMGNLHDRMSQLTGAVFRQMFDAKVPLIKYGRRKRRYRRMYPRMPDVRIVME